MSRTDALLRLTARLMSRRDALRKIVSSEVDRLREQSEVVGNGDHADAAVDSANDELCSRLAEIECRELEEIEEALRRLAEGTYGRCESCGGRIPAMRLSVLPCTTRCIECQRRDEQRGRFPHEFHAAESWSEVDDRVAPEGGSEMESSYDDFSVRIECSA